MTPAELIVDELLAEVDRLAVLKLAAKHLRATAPGVKGQWAEQRVLRAADADAWKENGPE